MEFWRPRAGLGVFKRDSLSEFWVLLEDFGTERGVFVGRDFKGVLRLVRVVAPVEKGGLFSSLFRGVAA